IAVNGQNVDMFEHGDDFGFPRETAQEVGFQVGVQIDDFERYLPFNRTLASSVNHRHPAATNRLFDDEVTYLFTCPRKHQAHRYMLTTTALLQIITGGALFRYGAIG